MKIFRLLNHVARENTYLLVNDQAIIVVDPGSNTDKIKEKITAIDKPVAAILITHAHYDHIMGLDVIRDAFGQPPVYISEKEASWLYSPKDNFSGLDRHADMDDVILKPAEYHFQYQEDYVLAGFRFQARQTPGHSWGSVSLVFPDDDLVLTGDALFRETIGRTDLPTGNAEQLLNSIKTELFSLPNHFTVYPGHGRETTIAHEKNFNPYFNTLWKKLKNDYLAGHSLGGVVACMNADAAKTNVTGLILLASYPSEKTDLSKDKLKVLSITASKDKILKWNQYNKAKKRLPQDTKYVNISGGNHSEFGDYGHQAKDGKASISQKEQEKEIATAITSFIN